MFKSLVATCMLSMGVANVTPILDNTNLPQKADNEIQNYTLALNMTTEATNTINNQLLVDTNNSVEGINYVNDKENKKAYTGTNIALNVLATNYVTNTYSTGTQMLMIQNYNWINNQYRYWQTAEMTTRSVMIMQIDSYNFNQNTSVNVHTILDISFVGFNNQSFTPKNKWLLRKIYTNYQNDWSTFINRQITTWTGERILEEINDPNNNYFFTTQSDLIPITSDTKDDNFEVELVPNGKTYIAIEYVPIVEMQEEYDETIALLPTYNDYVDFHTGNWTITGTNIIPSGTYEVIDIGGLMMEILTMPFAFISQAFNLTLFPGTPYQINISNLFLSIIAILVFVWLVGLFLKMKG